MSHTYNIAFCVSDDYIKYTCVTIQSIIENNFDRSFIVHIVVDKMSKQSRDLLKSNFADTKNLEIRIHEIDDTKLEQLKLGRWSKHAWYRILLPEILPKEDKVLYLDADTIVCENIGTLFNINLTEKSIAGITDCSSDNKEVYDRCSYPKEKGYICSGILMMNLNYWREHRLSKKLITWAVENADKIKYPDQDSINHICQDSKIVLPIKYGFMVHHILMNSSPDYELRHQIKEAYAKPHILHYSFLVNPYTIQYPWIGESSNPYKSEWLKYNSHLKQPVKIKYLTKGLNGLKVKLWDLFNDRTQPVRKELKRIIDGYND